MLVRERIEWVTQVRCVQDLHVCILARNQRIGESGSLPAVVDFRLSSRLQRDDDLPVELRAANVLDDHP